VGDLVISAGQNAQVLPAAAGATLAFAGTVAVGGGGSLALVNLALPAQSLAAALRGLFGAGSRLSLEAVTVVEHAEWGVLTGTVTAGADEGLVLDPAVFLDSVPHFTVTSGPCTTAVVDGHFCVGRWPGGYLPNERCDILVGGGGGGAAGGVLGPCPVFDTHGEDTYGDLADALTLPGGADYHDTSCPAGAPLAAGDAISWTSDGAQQGHHGNGLPESHDGAGGGWQICFA
jgi:hypothetical protein